MSLFFFYMRTPLTVENLPLIFITINRGFSASNVEKSSLLRGRYSATKSNEIKKKLLKPQSDAYHFYIGQISP